MEKLKIRQNFLDNVDKKILSNSGMLSVSERQEFVHLLEILLNKQNQPKRRNGFTKAKILANWLIEKGLQAKVIPVDNLDPRKKANKDNKWYLVEAIIGDNKFSNKTVNGVLLVHHDQVAKTINDFKRSQNAKIIYHPWIIDDSVHVAAAMMEILNFKNWWEKHADEYKVRPCIRLLISDGEEMNTLGMRALLAKWRKAKSLFPLNFMLIGESTGEKDLPPGVAYTNSGKTLGMIKSTPGNASLCQNILDFLIRFRTAQKYIYIKSLADPKSNLPQVMSSRLSSTYGRLKEQGEFFWEIRTNNILDTNDSRDLLKRIMHAEKSELKKFIKTVKNFERKRKLKYNFELKGLYKHVSLGDRYILQIKTKKLYHPGAYNPFNLDDIYSALEILLFNMSEVDVCELKEMYYGDRDKPNTVGNSIYLVFGKKINLRETVSKIVDLDDGLYERINALYDNFFKMSDFKITWKVEEDTFTPPRDTLGNYADNKWLVDVAKENLQSNILETTGEKANVPVTVFNAMHDGGFTTQEKYKNILWERGENVIVLGTGDFGILHGKEYLTPDTLIYGMLEYKNLLQKCFVKCAEKKRSHFGFSTVAGYLRRASRRKRR